MATTINALMWTCTNEQRAAVRAVAWSPNNKYIITGTENRDVRVHDAKTGTVLFTTPLESNGDLETCASDIVVSPDSSFVVVRVQPGDRFVRISLTCHEQQESVKCIGYFQGVDMSRNGEYIFGARAGGALEVYSSSTLTLVKRVRFPAALTVVAATPNADVVVLGFLRAVDAFHSTTVVRLVNWKTEDIVLEMPIQLIHVVSACVSKCGRWVLFGAPAGQVRLLDTCAYASANVFDIATQTYSTITGVAFSPNSRFYAIAEPKFVHVWALATRELVRIFTCADEPIEWCKVAFSADNTRIVAVDGRCGHTTVWDLYHNARLKILATLGHLSWSRFLLDKDGDHAIASRVFEFLIDA